MRKDIYKSALWTKTRKEVWKMQNCLCARCGKPVYVYRLSEHIPKERRMIGIVHHKKYLTDTNYNDKSIAYDLSNLEGLCIDCHNKEHKSSVSVREDVYFDEEGNIRKKGV